MKYHKARKLIKTGDLLAFKGTWFMSRGIQWFTKSEISHVGIAVQVSFNGSPPVLCVFESMEGSNVRLHPLYKSLETLYWPKGGKCYWKSLKPNYSGADLMDFCVEHWIDSYASIYQFFLVASPRLQWLRKLRGGVIDLPGYHCSELISAGLKEQDFELPKETAAQCTPGDVYTFNCWSNVGVELEYSSRKQVFGYRYTS